MELRRWLLTGSSGYLGSQLVSKLLEEKETFLVLLDKKDFFISHPNLVVYQGDMGDRDILDTIFQEHRIEGILHLGASKSVLESFAYPEQYLENNFTKSKILYDRAALHHVKKFIFASSAAVYSEDLSEGGGMVNESSKTNPKSPYGASKLLAEEFFRSANSSEMETTSLRFFNISGFNSFNVQNFGAINTILNCAIDSTTFAINQSESTGETSLGAVRDYLDISDAIVSLIAVMKAPVEPGFETFNISTGIGTSLERVIERVEFITKKILKRSISKGNFEEIKFMVGDPSKFYAKYRVKPERELDDIILNMFLSKHPNR